MNPNEIKMEHWVPDYLKLIVIISKQVISVESLFPDDNPIEPSLEEKAYEAIFTSMGIEPHKHKTKSFDGKEVYAHNSVEIATEWDRVVVDVKGGAFRNLNVFGNLVSLIKTLDSLNIPNYLQRTDVCIKYWRNKQVKKADLILEPFKGLLKEDGYWFDRASVRARFWPQCLQRETGNKNTYARFSDKEFSVVSYSINGKIEEFKRRAVRIRKKTRRLQELQAAISDFERNHDKGTEYFKLECRALSKDECQFADRLIRNQEFQDVIQFAKAIAEHFYSRHAIVKKVIKGKRKTKKESHSFKKFFVGSLTKKKNVT